MTLVKSYERLAIEILGKTRGAAEDHLVRYGMTWPEAAAVAATHTGSISHRIIGTIGDIAETIEKEVS